MTEDGSREEAARVSRRRGWWYYTRDIVRNYPVLRERLRELRTPGTTGEGLGRSSEPGRSTERLALRDLPKAERRELEAVERAIAVTRGLPDGKERLQVIRLVHWRMSHTMTGAAQTVHVSLSTAYRWQNDFFVLVARLRGLVDKKP